MRRDTFYFLCPFRKRECDAGLPSAESTSFKMTLFSGAERGGRAKAAFGRFWGLGLCLAFPEFV